ncbi:MAG TPA: 4Fe-4S dicluster domain-containing protein [Phycisphaerae bacterium]|nr:4Fe-4S dicluster domain-containing protein [Phycisphaerae bacterium]
MNTAKLNRSLRRLGRVLLLLILGYPQLVIVLPIIGGLIVLVTHDWAANSAERGWHIGNVLIGMGLATAIILFGVLALLHVSAILYCGWKGHAAVYRRGRWDAVTRPVMDGVISRERLLSRLDALRSERTLIGPVARSEPQCDPPIRYFSQPVNSADDLALDFTHSVYGPKQWLLPPHETLLQFDSSDGHFKTTPCVSGQAMALILHPCDLHGITLLDQVFGESRPDQHYLARRSRTLLIGIDCPTLCTPEAFCRDMMDENAVEHFDVMLFPLRAAKESDGVHDYAITYGTDAGRDWLESPGARAVRVPTVREERRFEEYLEEKRRASTRKLKKGRKQLAGMLDHSYDSLIWDATAKRCYSCGSCNLVCPTCYCFDIQDECEMPLTKNSRVRSWDSCMLRDFSLVAGGHNFRKKASQRLRHRIFRKASWIEDRTGISGCAGCGRCIRACTAHISIVDILNQLAEESASPHASQASPRRAVAGGVS